ncbi:hypothetical protein AU468_07610 [Alkalispirochaeta sphaeroplastigenens]|uniref:Peptidase C-terminal archaeal/bacterial domain-containing protein n=1 Tax=Alkalispirochaeta sphaeroplastigenens TaxID=1187066 RepID=A0A2S4JQQ0_9SPIO|nr:hypothetical protein [Alkalispirochaeta sphaeroplastigenens]POR01812.1 hypothetical protein AU468_07610 [Alkalispirochaeta sphaeroplastigenens]
MIRERKALVRLLSVLLLMAGVGLLQVTAQEELLRASGEILRGSVLDDSRNIYRVRVEEGALIEVIAASTEVDTWIDAELPDGTALSNDDYDGLNAGFLRVMPASGHLVIRVSAAFRDHAGRYTLTVTARQNPREISPGDISRGSLEKGGAGGDRWSSLYRLRGRGGDEMTIDLRSDDFDAFLEVVDQEGRSFYDDDGGEGFNSRLVYRFQEDGTLLVIATSFGGSSTGSYELEVSSQRRTLVARYEGTLREGGRRAYDGRLYSVYEYEGRPGQSVRIALDSDDFDPVLYVSHPDGRPLSMDDDGGGDGNSLLDIVLPASGIYRLFVVPFYEAYGRYELRIYE